MQALTHSLFTNVPLGSSLGIGTLVRPYAGEQDACARKPSHSAKMRRIYFVVWLESSKSC